ncbi:ATP-binding cassette domain-containing protein [Pseudomonas sp. gcc21]|uniref:ABC transporter ATP-binding protein n=1 Tax=Pseudomonas sp. gcc21 TaxID=2726989 RepID=UPI0014514954|nr:ATP-binding cassette domain-containing protein [Pseudomonas sp. gcc21]QJD57439.1 ATP-binding cassette domain-containing protein [Pseudomonas sp. gcc21]
MRAISLEIINASKSFGSFQALSNVSLTVRAGTVHALLGENGAGKSTLVKGIVGYGPLDDGELLVNNRQQRIRTPRESHALGIGMVYQHFTVAPGLSVAENLVLSRGDLKWRIDWPLERQRLEAFMQRMPFRLDIERPVSSLAAGEKQKLEILKQLYLDRQLIILDEPTSVLTPQEAEEVLGLMRDMAHRGDISVLMITHKFGEVSRFADDVSVLRKGTLVGSTQVKATSQEELATWMMGAAESVAEPVSQRPVDRNAAPRLEVRELNVANDRGTLAVKGLSLDVRPGEIVGIAGISGNGQRELTEALLGQRQTVSGEIRINGAPYKASRREMQKEKVFSLPEEPLRNACIAGMSVADNLALRNFDQPPICRQGWLINRRAIQAQAAALIQQFNVRPADPLRPIGTLSGGNVQRAVLARELTHDVRTLVVSNPVFGLDFASVAIIHQRLRDARAQGAAVLLLSEDLDELLELSDRILVIHEGEINLDVAAEQADRAMLGHYIAGGDHAAGAA